MAPPDPEHCPHIEIDCSCAVGFCLKQISEVWIVNGALLKGKRNECHSFLRSSDNLKVEAESNFNCGQSSWKTLKTLHNNLRENTVRWWREPSMIYK